MNASIRQPPGVAVTRVFQIGVVVLVAAAVLAHEGDTPTMRVLLALGMIGLALLDRLLPNPDPPARSRLSRGLDLLIVALVALVGVQLLPLPAGWVAAISPNTLALPGQFSDEPVGSTARLSLYPLATWRAFWQFACYGLFFVAVRNRLGRAEAIRPVALALVALGVGIAVVSVMQSLIDSESFYWFYKKSTNAYGPFANHNRFAGFANLCIGLSAGWLLFLLLGRGAEQRFELNDSGRFAVGRTTQIVMAIGALGVLVAAVALSLSRGGMISLLVALIVSGVAVLIRSGRGQGLKFVGLLAAPLLLAGLLIFLIGPRPVGARLATLNQDWQGLQASVLRFAQWQDSSATLEDFPLVGIGAGAYRYVHPHYKTVPAQLVFTHVENEYLQLLLETGVVGLLILMAMLSCLLLLAVRVCRAKKLAAAGWWGGLTLGVVALAVHCLGDFGPHKPSVGILFVALVAMWVGSGLRQLQENNPVPVSTALRRPWQKRWPTLATAAIAILFMAVNGIAEIRSDFHWRRFGRDPNPEHALAALWVLPGDLDRQLGLAELQIDQLSRQLARSYRVHLSTEQEHWQAAQDRLLTARSICPIFHTTHERLAQLHLLALGSPGADPEVHLARAAAANPTRAPVHRMRADLAMTQGRWDDAIAATRQSLRLDHRSLTAALDQALLCGATPAGLVEMVPEEPDLQLQAADYFNRYKLDPAGETRLLAAALVGWQAQLETLPDQIWLMCKLARAHRRLGQPQESLPHYQRLLQLQYANVGWRYEYAHSLREVGRLADALYQSKLCLRLKPRWEPALRLRDELLDSLAAAPDPDRLRLGKNNS